MATSRTSTTIWKRRRAQRIALAKAQGQTTCAKPGCGRWLDYNTHGQPDSPEVNHDEQFAITGEIAPPLEKLSVWCRACNGADGGQLGAAKINRGNGVKRSQVW